MPKIRASSREPKPKFRIGDWVAYTIGISRWVAEIIEDRGCFGRIPKRIYRLRKPMWYGEPMESEQSEQFLEPASAADLALRYPPEKSALLSS